MADLIYENDEGEFELVYFDATLQEIHTSSADVTDHPVAQGADITDHIRVRPDRLQLQVFVSNSPIRSPDVDGAEGSYQQVQLEGGVRTLETGATASEDPDKAEYDDATKTVGIPVLKFDSPFDRITAVYAKLRDLKDLGTRFLVVTRTSSYIDMVIKDVTTPRTAKDGDGASITLELRQIFTRSTETVDFPEPFDPRAEARRAQGSQAAEENETPIPESSSAALYEQFTGNQIQVSRIQGR